MKILIALVLSLFISVSSYASDKLKVPKNVKVISAVVGVYYDLNMVVQDVKTKEIYILQYRQDKLDNVIKTGMKTKLK